MLNPRELTESEKLNLAKRMDEETSVGNYIALKTQLLNLMAAASSGIVDANYLTPLREQLATSAEKLADQASLPPSDSLSSNS